MGYLARFSGAYEMMVYEELVSDSKRMCAAYPEQVICRLRRYRHLRRQSGPRDFAERFRSGFLGSSYDAKPEPHSRLGTFWESGSA